MQLIPGEDMDRSKRRFGLGAVAAFTLLFSQPSMAATSVIWSADDHVTIDFVGDITFSGDRIMFKNKKFLQIAPAGQASISDTAAIRSGATTADLFRVIQPADPVMAGGNRICGAPVTYIATWKPIGQNVPDRRLALFSSQTVPTSATIACNQFAYHVGR